MLYLLFAVLKARLPQPPRKAQDQQQKLRNYRVVHGSIATQQPLTIVFSSRTNSSSVLGDQELDSIPPAKRRYFVMGKTTAGQNLVNYAFMWPHKSAQLRKAIKAIKSGSIPCPDRAPVVTRERARVVTVPFGEDMD